MEANAEAERRLSAEEDELEFEFDNMTVKGRNSESCRYIKKITSFDTRELTFQNLSVSFCVNENETKRT